MLTLFTKPLEVLTAEDAATIIGWPESLTVEFKETLPARDGRADAWLSGGNFEQYARDKLFKEVVAFANTSGGHLVLGAAETKDAPPAAAALAPLPRCVELGERLARAAQAIDPPIPLLLVRGIPIQDDAGIVVFRVPASRAAPHRSPDKDCYARRGTESVPMNMREIQDMTLAAGRREEFTDVRFARAARQFAEWFVTPLDGQSRAAGFRITAVPVGARFDLRRLYGRDRLVSLRQRYQVTVNGARLEANAVRLPERSRPIVRGVRRTYDEEGAPIYLDLYSDGVVDLGFRVAPRTDEQVLFLGWMIAYSINVLCAADALRNAAGMPDCEYGFEMEVRSRPADSPINLVGWGQRFSGDDTIGEALRRLPLLLPRLSFGPIEELDQVVSLIANDLCDAAATHHQVPLTLSTDLPRRE